MLSIQVISNHFNRLSLARINRRYLTTDPKELIHQKFESWLDPYFYLQIISLGSFSPKKQWEQMLLQYKRNDLLMLRSGIINVDNLSSHLSIGWIHIKNLKTFLVNVKQIGIGLKKSVNTMIKIALWTHIDPFISTLIKNQKI